ncbi:hypothetical protein SKAU_G00211770 [Synaphobranchus kaupii]|uniref:Uncharacterized protein n=1 Tax=Synaphobranchus kaupii TaxID=118154 RepID=A0A9Q1ISZ4_SYNKA|nr:hypothetical protein SKAU_G00211770 [Synaphobranchus kaupii]
MWRKERKSWDITALMAMAEASQVTRVGLARSKYAKTGGEVSWDFRRHTASEQADVQSQGSPCFNSFHSGAVMAEYCGRKRR